MVDGSIVRNFVDKNMARARNNFYDGETLKEEIDDGGRSNRQGTKIRIEKTMADNAKD